MRGDSQWKGPSTRRPTTRTRYWTPRWRDEYKALEPEQKALRRQRHAPAPPVEYRSSTPQQPATAATTAGRAAAEGLRRLLPRGLRQWGPPMEAAAAAGRNRAAAGGGGPGPRERGRAAPGAGPRHPSGCPCCGGDGGLGPKKCWACGASRLGCAPAAPCGHCFALPHADGTAASRGFGSGAPPTWEDGLFARKEDEAEEEEEEDPGAGEAKPREEVAGAGGAQASPDPFQCSLVSGGGGALSGLPGAP